jgi:uncharacterized membrane protein YbhN (UPF0104 family)
MVLVLKLAVGLFLLGLVALRVPLDGAAAAAGLLTPAAVIAAVALYFAAHAVNAVKLRVLLPQLSLGRSWRFTMIAVLYGTALPGQLAGDAVKAFRMARAAGEAGELGGAVAATVVDKMTGLFALLLLTALGIGLEAGRFGPTVTAAAGTITATIAALLLVALIAPQRWLGRWGHGYGSWRSIALRPAALLQSLGLGLIFQGLSIAVFAILGGALGLELSLAAWAVIVGLVSVILLLPVTVAGIGLRDGSLVAVLAALGQDQGAALALSLSLLVLNILGALVGLIVDLAGRDRV